jgi:hypothetical protein
MPTPTTLRLRRRRFLGNTALMTVAAPFVQLLASRRAEAAAPRRMVLLFSGNGHRRGQWATRRSDTDFDLLRISKPLEPFKQDLILFKNLNIYAMRKCKFATTKHGLGSGIAFTGTGVIGNGWPTGASVDQIVAGRIGNQTPIASLQLGSGCHDTNVYGRVSYAAGGKPLAPEQVPAAAFANLFKPVLDRAMPGAAGAAATDKLLARHRSVLDFVRNDVCELRAELGAEDRKRLETHCDSLRQVEKGLGGGDMLAAGASCKAPTEALVNARFTASNYEQSVKDQVALTRLALACRLTHVVCLQLGQAHGGVTASRLGVGGGHHHVSHWRGSGAGEEPYIKVSVFYAEMVAHLLGALKAVDEGGSSLLDNTVMLWGSDVTDGEEHGEDDAPWAMFGGRAMGWKTGRMLDVQKRNQNDLLISMAHAMGLPDVKTIGHEDLCSGPMPGVT